MPKGIFSFMSGKSAIGKEIAHYTELETQLVRDKAEYLSIINNVGTFITSHFPDLNFCPELFFSLQQSKMAVKFLLNAFFEQKGYRKDQPQANSVFQTLFTIHWEELKPYCKLFGILGPGEAYKDYANYPNLFHYFHSGAIVINPDTHVAELCENVDSVINEYCSLRIENKAEEDFMKMAEDYRTKLHLFADTRDQLQELENNITGALPKETAGTCPGITGIEFFESYMRFQGKWIRLNIDTDYMTSIYNRIIERFVPIRKKKENKCYDLQPYMEDPDIFAYTGYKEPNPTQSMMDEYPELYGKSDYALFRERLEKELKDIPPYKRDEYESNAERDFIAHQMNAAAKYVKERSEYPNRFN